MKDRCKSTRPWWRFENISIDGKELESFTVPHEEGKDAFQILDEYMQRVHKTENYAIGELPKGRGFGCCECRELGNNNEQKP